MSNVKRVIYSACVAVLALVPTESEADSPRTLRMRKVDRDAARKAWTRRPLIIAQTPTPDPAPTDPPPGDGTTPPPDPNVPAPAPTPSPTPDPPAPPPDPNANVPATPDLTDEELAKLAEAQAEEKGEVIVVTGSTIERRELTTAAPVTVLDKTDLEGAGLATVGDIIQNLPAQSNAINAQVNNGGDGSTRVDIRGLGSNRTLVLLNGRRVVPGGIGADASVDLNAIPLAVIERVEVLKDGASAVYGSDAIGGVVNIITREDFTGTEATLYTGTAQRGDGFNYDMSFVTGHKAEKGHVIFSAGWQRQDPVFAGDRGFAEFDKDFDWDAREEFNSGSSATPNGRIGTGVVDWDNDGDLDEDDAMHPMAMGLCGASACQPDGNGGWLPFTAPGDLYNYQPANYLYTPSQRYNVFGGGTYKFTKNAKVFFEGLYLNRKSDQQLAPEPFLAATPISGQSIYNPLGVDVYDYRRRLEEFGPRRFLQNVDTFRVVTGVSGKIPADAPVLKNWKWEVSYNYGHTTGLQQNEGNLILSRLANALGPSFIDGNGVPRCGTPGNEIPECVPLDIMGRSGSISRDQRDYVTFTGVSTGFNDQKMALAQASGRIVKLPNGGDISLAIGGDYRREEGGFTPDPLTSTGDTTGNAQAPTGGSYDVFEGFGELSIVPLSKQKYAEWVELNLAARGFRYSTFGSGVTWKAGGLFKTIGGLAARGTYSTAFRAPSVGELFAGKADDFPTAIDPCDTSDGPLAPDIAARCAAEGVPANAMFGTTQQRAIIGGNSNLEAETANVFTAGIVYEPPQVKGLSLTVDYFNIEINDAIQALGAQVILANCYTRGIEADCARITRDPQLGYAIDFIEDSLTNVGGTRTDGIDFAIAFDHKLRQAGRFRYQFEGQYLRGVELDNTFDEPLQGVGFYDLGVYPKWKANFSTFWEREGISAGLNVRYIGGFKECQNNDCNSEENLEMFSRDVPSNITGDLFAGYMLKSPAGVTRVTVGVNNITDTKPSLIYIGFAGDSDASTYDYMGRYFYARLSQLF